MSSEQTSELTRTLSNFEESHDKNTLQILRMANIDFRSIAADYLVLVDDYPLKGSCPSRHVYLVPKEIAESIGGPEYMQRCMENPYCFLQQEILDNPSLAIKRVKGAKNMPISLVAWNSRLGKPLGENEIASRFYGAHIGGEEKDDPFCSGHFCEHMLERGFDQYADGLDRSIISYLQKSIQNG